MAIYTNTHNPQRVQASQELRRSNAAGAHVSAVPRSRAKDTDIASWLESYGYDSADDVLSSCA